MSKNESLVMHVLTLAVASMVATYAVRYIDKKLTEQGVA